ncbi:MAG TPA: 16S rRNA (adenine(1518)-N(6)/adenine(1519)-N(6))-dimethyltransferase, partial [Gammaproteobacteria bacterium]|nr:16S rRNA (adenine(1518)-N(6)/adenine(1519)-N(6))-dimethyltransferase [Gammaproteobacteria bacterium]
NLPYNISTPLIFHLLNSPPIIQDMHFMLQLEVVNRLAAEPGSKTYGRLSVITQYHCHVQKLFEVGREAFSPAPKVSSAIVRLAPYTKPPVDVGNREIFTKLVTAAFAQRRKTLRNTLKSWLSETEIEKAGVDPGNRAEQLNLSAFASLSRAAQNR